MTERESETKLADDQMWKRALDCACSQFEGYARRDELQTADSRRRAIDDAMQHAFGILSLSASPSEGQAALSQPSGSGVPVAWTIPGDDTADANGFITARVTEEGEFTKPLYASPSEGQAADAQMLLVKACEHIACGDEGWEKLRNECPSTAAVASLRDAFEAARDAGLEDWQPIETRPDSDKPCWIADDVSNTMVVAYPGGRMPKGVWYLMWADRMLGWTPSHWQPLPVPLKSTPPKGNGGHQQQMDKGK